jgi:glycosyltransferase involved in cell wall biosynthesis
MGGVSTLAYEVTRSMNGRIAECVYLGPRGTNFGARQVNFKVYEDWESDTSLRAGDGSDLEDERIFDLMRKIIKSYGLDAIVAFHPFYYGPAATAVAEYLRIPSAVMVHGTELTSQFKTAIDGQVDGIGSKPMTDSIADRLVLTMKRSKTVLANSQFTAAIAKNIAPGISPAVVGCGLPSAIFDHLVERTPIYRAQIKVRRRIRLGLGEEAMIAYVGRLVPHKNLFRLIDIGVKTGFTVVIIGTGPLREKLEDYSTKLGARTIFVDNADDDRKWQILEAADFGYLMSDYDQATGGYEGFGISMLEYPSAGAICLTSGTHGMADFAEDGVTTLNPMTSDSEIDVERLLSLSRSESRMNDILSNARSRIREEYTWERVADKVLEFV